MPQLKAILHCEHFFCLNGDEISTLILFTEPDDKTLQSYAITFQRKQKKEQTPKIGLSF
jgi:hypothetical protein